MVFKFFGSSGAQRGILEQAVDDFLSMIEHSHWMFQRAGDVLWGKAELDTARTEVYQRDILVNKAERAVRKAIISHLAVNPRSDTAFCLILMSVGKDAERVGDYCKNIMDLPDYHTIGEDRNQVTQELQRIHEAVGKLFPKVVAAFRESDEEAGGELVRAEREVTVPCDDIIEQVLASSGLSNRQAVAYTLLARFYKRIAAHLGNIASSLVMPVHKLDYFDEEHLPGLESPADEET